MLTCEAMARVLGLPGNAPARTPFELISTIESGLPVTALERVSRLLSPNDAQFKFRFVPKATYERRKAAHRLSADEGTRLARVAGVWGLALDVWKTEDAARDFMFRPHAMLDDRSPVEVVIQSEIGAELVRDVLVGLKYGSAA